MSKTFEGLFLELEGKLAAHDPASGTVKAIEAGYHSIGKKLVEEAAEVWMAAEYQTPEETALEISQLIYHTQVMMLACGLDLEDVYRYL
ncbi:MAG: phosphoribosyl-ATP diphosphatase [Propionibacteriaceae bacterium]|nr:phosphoribosyl-ATP diphosphatase [Propionibacteriaceae bacterium]